MDRWPEPLLSWLASPQQAGLPAAVKAYFLLIGGVLAVMGAGVIVIGVRQQSAAHSLLKYGVRVPGTVVRFVQVSMGESSYPCPVVRFRTLDGQDVETRTRIRPRRRDSAGVGQAVWVIYDQRNPQSAVIGAVSSTLGCAGILIIYVGSMFALGGLVFLALGVFLP